MPTATLTARQQEVLDFIRTHHANYGLMPSTREVQAFFEFGSQTAAMGHMRALARKGALVNHPGKARAYVLPESLEGPEAPTVEITSGAAFGSEAQVFRIS